MVARTARSSCGADRTASIRTGARSYPVSNFSGFPIARDLTGNGYPDLIIGGGKPTVGAPHDAFTHIFWNGPAGLSPDRQAQLPANAASGIAVADFNNDGYPDIFTCSYQAVNDRDIDSYIYWGGPGGSFSAKNRARLRTHSSSGCIAADFNEDGYIDIAVANHKSFGDHVGDSFVLWNGPDGIDDRHPTRLPTAGPHGCSKCSPATSSTAASANTTRRRPSSYPPAQQ